MQIMIIVLAITAIVAIIMLVKCPPLALGYLYCVVVGLIMATVFLSPYISKPDDIFFCVTLGAGLGAVFGLLFASIINDDNSIGSIIATAIFLPILMLIVGFILVMALAFFFTILSISNSELFSILSIVGLIAALGGGGGSVIVILSDN